MKRESKIVAIDDVKPYPGNARRGDVGALQQSLRYHGQYRDIVVQASTGFILAGNHTWQAAKAEGWSEIGVCYVDADDAQAKKIVLVDNRTNDIAGYDIPALADLLQGLDSLDGTGFDDKALEEVMGSLGLGAAHVGADADEAPSAPSVPVTALGDLYQLGRHRLLCGDSTDAGAVDRLLDGAQVELLFTDPPYNMNFDGRKGKWLSKDSQRPQEVLKNDNLTDDDFDLLLSGSLSNGMVSLVDGGSAYVFCDWRHYPQVTEHFDRTFTHKSTIVWDKTHFGMGVHYRMQYELLLFGCRGDKPAIWTAGKQERDVWSIQRENTREYKHVTQKPVEIAERAIKNSSKADHRVLDLFGGSGTTMAACEVLGRSSYLMELDERYCDVIVKRYENLTGEKAVRL